MRHGYRAIEWCARSFLAAIALGAMARWGALAAEAPTTKPVSADVERRIKALESYYAKVYGEPLESGERLPREIAIVSLSRIDAAETTQRLLDVFKSKE